MVVKIVKMKIKIIIIITKSITLKTIIIIIIIVIIIIINKSTDSMRRLGGAILGWNGLRED